MWHINCVVPFYKLKIDILNIKNQLNALAVTSLVEAKQSFLLIQTAETANKKNTPPTAPPTMTPMLSPELPLVDTLLEPRLTLVVPAKFELTLVVPAKVSKEGKY